MARRQDVLMEDVRRIRRQISKRLEKAMKEGKLREEREQIEREGEAVYRQALNGSTNGHKPKRK
jgi:hypothetical protein